MSEPKDPVTNFMLACIEDMKKVHPEPTTTQYHHYLIIQTIGKIHELEERLKELENE